MIILLFSSTESRRRTSTKNRQFEGKEVTKESVSKPVLENLFQENVKNNTIENMQKNTYETVNEKSSVEIMKTKNLGDEGYIL
jgi:hypothetical protein